jgi:hypothetical protein
MNESALESRDVSSRIAEVLAVLAEVSTSRPKTIEDVRASRIKACLAVATQRQITQNTVQDACTRQLELNRDQFDNHLLAWLTKGASDLETILLSHVVNDDDTKEIQQFFSSAASTKRFFGRARLTFCGDGIDHPG